MVLILLFFYIDFGFSGWYLKKFLNGFGGFWGCGFEIDFEGIGFVGFFLKECCSKLM